jgi:transposase-like protein
MNRRPRRNHTPAFKAKVALAAIKGDRTLVQLAEQLFFGQLHRLRRTRRRNKGCRHCWESWRFAAAAVRWVADTVR